MADNHDESRERDDHSGVETTGHEWDGIKELDNPLPRWWLWILYASVVWAVVYMVFMPAIPGLPGLGDHTRGITDNSERRNVAEAVAELEASRAGYFEQLQQAGSIDAIESDPDLLGFAMAAGRSAFGDNCATCHGAGAQGFVGYPNLNDDVWLWGGTFEDIQHTLRVGIRSEHRDTRYSQMPAFGRDELLSREEINQVTDYVLTLSGREPETLASAEAGAEIFVNQCSACHMEDGTGDRFQGAPNLTDADWLYGGERAQIINTIWRGPYGVMPSWEGRLDDQTITALAAYVYFLGGGESDAFIEAAQLNQD